MALNLVFLSDQETKVDLLNNEAIASTIVRLLCTRPDQPVTIGVHGDWGAGKSSVLEMIEEGFAKKDRALCVKFNGWRFQGFEDAKIALMEGIVTSLLEERPGLTKVTEKVKEVFHRIDWLKVAKRTGGLAFTAMSGLPSPDLIRTALNNFTALATGPNKTVNAEQLNAAVAEIQGLLKNDGETRKLPDEVREFRKAFDELLEAADIDHLIVLVDDLDRCLPDTAIETLEAIRLFVFTSRTAFVVAADEGMIEYAVRKHFPDLPSSAPHSYARNYLEKLIQIPFRIPALGETETRIYVSLLLVGALLGEEDETFKGLLGAARTMLRRPWTGETLDIAAVRRVLGDGAAEVEPVLQLSDQIGPVLARGTSGNPRQIKRFLNLLALRQHVAEARGFGDDIKLTVLAKLMLLERFESTVFEQLATTAARNGGICPELEELEAIAGGSPVVQFKTAKKKSSPDTKSQQLPTPTVSPLTQEWAKSESICHWAALSPPLKGIDLRPYLFLTKDRRDRLSSMSLGTLAPLVDQLMGPSLAVAGLATDLQQLTDDLARRVFEEIQARIVASSEYDSQPDGIAGLRVLVKSKPVLQSVLLDFLEGLPVDNLGPWVIRGWDEVLVDDPSQRRLGTLRQRWQEGGSHALAAALKAAGAVPQRAR